MKAVLSYLTASICVVFVLNGCGSGGSTSPALATPTITWAAPAAITFGTALSSAQLDASANYPGTFTYTPASGSVLAAGTQALTATFTPSQPTTVAFATATSSLTVNKATPTVSWNVPSPVTAGTGLSHWIRKSSAGLLQAHSVSRRYDRWNMGSVPVDGRRFDMAPN